MKNRLVQSKLELIDECFKNDKTISSFVDLGGAWQVHGGYTFYILSKYPIKKACLVDDNVLEPVKASAVDYPQLKLIETNFGSSNAITKTDVILFFDILLHQVNPDWDKMLEMYAPKTKYFLIHNPQFNNNTTVRLLDLGKDEYFNQCPKLTNNVHYNKLFTEQEHEVRDIHNIWQWGITDKDLQDVMTNLGFELTYTIEGNNWGETKFKSRGFIFKKV